MSTLCYTFGLVLLLAGGKPGAPDGGGIFDVNAELAELEVPPQGAFARKLLADGTKTSVFVLKTGKGLPPHYHERTDEVVYILKGEATFTLGNESKDVGPGDVMVIPVGAVHAVELKTDQVEALIVNTPPVDPAAPADRVFIEKE